MTNGIIPQTKMSCPKCGDTGTVCWACDKAIDECECGEDQEPVPCDRCHGPLDSPGWEGGFAENH